MTYLVHAYFYYTVVSQTKPYNTFFSYFSISEDIMSVFLNPYSKNID